MKSKEINNRMIENSELIEFLIKISVLILTSENNLLETGWNQFDIQQYCKFLNKNETGKRYFQIRLGMIDFYALANVWNLSH